MVIFNQQRREKPEIEGEIDKEEGRKYRSHPPSYRDGVYFSTIASTGQTSEQLPHSVHFSSLIT
jgi:hypothetical protein